MTPDQRLLVNVVGCLAAVVLVVALAIWWLLC